MDAVFAGLVDRHGPKNVIDWPPKDKHREGVPTLTGDAEKDYGAERRSLCYTPHCLQLPKLTQAEVRGLMAAGEIERIFVDERAETFEEYVRLGAHIFDIPVVVVAGHDRFWGDLVQLNMGYGKKLEARFLDNWRDEYEGLPNTFPMSYATNFDHLWDVSKRKELLADKQYDVCFMGYNSNPVRGYIIDHLKSKYGGLQNYLFVERQANSMGSFVRKSEYFRIMAQSRVCINLAGAAECGKALRFYEIPYVGSCMLSQKFNGKQVHPFVDGQHCFYFNSLPELDNLIETMLLSDTIRERIAAAGHEHAMKFHTARARVDYIYGCLNGQG